MASAANGKSGRTLLLGDSGLELLVDGVRPVFVERSLVSEANIKSEVKVARAVSEVGSCGQNTNKAVSNDT